MCTQLPPAARIRFLHDVFKRLSDGAIFRVTSNGSDKQAPTVGTLDMCQVTAEKWELTK